MVSNNELIAPSRNPDVGKRAVIDPVVAVDMKTVVPGSALVPDIESRRRNGGVAKEFFYWVGVTPSCPVQHVDIAGINFPKVNENLIDDPLRSGTKKRVPVIGAIVRLNEKAMKTLRERLPRTVIRFTDDEGEREEPGTGQNIGDVFRRPRRGHLITIPTAEEVAQRRATGRPTREYVPRPSDVPAARFMFAVYCSDQTRGNRGDVYPDPLETAGLRWPLELADELLS